MNEHFPVLSGSYEKGGRTKGKEIVEKDLKRKSLLKNAARSALGWINRNFAKVAVPIVVTAPTITNAADINRMADNEFLKSKPTVGYSMASQTDTTENPGDEIYKLKVKKHTRKGGATVTKKVEKGDKSLLDEGAALEENSRNSEKENKNTNNENKNSVAPSSLPGYSSTKTNFGFKHDGKVIFFTSNENMLSAQKSLGVSYMYKKENKIESENKDVDVKSLPGYSSAKTNFGFKHDGKVVFFTSNENMLSAQKSLGVDYMYKKENKKETGGSYENKNSMEPSSMPGYDPKGLFGFKYDKKEYRFSNSAGVVNAKKILGIN